MLSVVITNYNKEKYLRGCLQSTIESCKYAQIDYEIIIIDDCSTDNSIDSIGDIINSNKNIKLSEILENVGICYVRNLGLKKAKYNQILFVDGDVKLKLEAVKELMLNKDKADIIFPTVEYRNGNIMTPRNDEERAYLKMSTLFMINKVPLFEKKIFFDEIYFFYYEDEDFFTRCKLHGLTAFHIDKTLATHPNKDFNLTPTTLFFRLRNPLFYYLKYRTHLNLSLIKTAHTFLRESYLGITRGTERFKKIECLMILLILFPFILISIRKYKIE